MTALSASLPPQYHGSSAGKHGHNNEPWTVGRSIQKKCGAAFLYLLVLPTLSGCWYVLGDPSIYTAIQAYAPGQTREKAARTIDQAMSAAGLERMEAYTTAYLIEGRTISYADYEHESCDIKTDEDQRQCLSDFNERAVPQRTGEIHTDDEIKSSFSVPDGHASVEVAIADHKGGSIVCVEFYQFPATEFDPKSRAAIARLRTTMIDRFGDENVANAPCGVYSTMPYWPG